jgi:hypothetical protein
MLFFTTLSSITEFSKKSTQIIPFFQGTSFSCY